MKSACLIFLVIGVTHAAMQQRSPVYPSTANTGVNTSTGPNSAKSSLVPSQTVPAPSPVNNQPIAQAREGQGTAEAAVQPGTPGTSPSQNYLVYYYPNEYRNVPTQVGGAQQYAYKSEGTSFLNWSGWREVGYGTTAAAFVVVGSGILFNVFGPTVKSRALRKLQDMNSDDVARMARNVLKGIEKFRDMTTSGQ